MTSAQWTVTVMQGFVTRKVHYRDTRALAFAVADVIVQQAELLDIPGVTVLVEGPDGELSTLRPMTSFTVR